MKPLDARLLAALRASEVHLPATDLSTQLRTPLAVIEARLAELRRAGFVFDERPGLGFRLVRSPDRLTADDLASRLGECSLAREIVVFAETRSTNDSAMQRGLQGGADGLAIFAESQTAGRGRFGRAWASAAHRGLWFSLLLRPELPPAHWARLTTWAAAGVAAAIEALLGIPAAIKWPNDIYLHGRKVAGILAESGADPAGKPFAVLGIGVNVNHETTDFPEELAARATSLKLAFGHPVDRVALAAAILQSLDDRRKRLDNGGFPALVDEVSRRSTLLGHWVQVQAGKDLFGGRAEHLDAEGRLALRLPDGRLISLSAGEVTVIAQ